MIRLHADPTLIRVYKQTSFRKSRLCCSRLVRFEEGRSTTGGGRGGGDLPAQALAALEHHWAAALAARVLSGAQAAVRLQQQQAA